MCKVYIYTFYKVMKLDTVYSMSIKYIEKENIGKKLLTLPITNG